MDCASLFLLIPIYFPTLIFGFGAGLGLWFGFFHSLFILWWEKRKK